MTINLAAIRAKYDALKRGDSNRWSPSKGVNDIMILSFFHGKQEFVYVESARHFGVLKFMEKGGVIECPKVLLGQDCEICSIEEAVIDSQDDFEPEVLELVKNWDKSGSKSGNLKPRPVLYFNVFDLKHPEHGIQVFACSKALAQEILGMIAAVDANGNLLYPDLCSREHGIPLQLYNTGEGWDRYTLKVPTVREGDVMRIRRYTVPSEFEPKDLFKLIQAPGLEYTKAAVTATNKDQMPKNPEFKSRIDVWGEPKPGLPGWLQYFVDESLAAEPQSVPVAKKSSGSLLEKFKKDKATNIPVSVQEVSSKPAERQRKPMLKEDEDLPWCCGWSDEASGQSNAGKWLGENSEACKVCLAEDMCKEFTYVDIGIDGERSPVQQGADGIGAEGTEGFPEQEAKEVRQPAKAKKVVKSTSALVKNDTASILQRLKNRKK